MQELQQYFAEKLTHRELAENKEIGLESFLDYIVEQDTKVQIERDSCGLKIWKYIKETCD